MQGDWKIRISKRDISTIPEYEYEDSQLVSLAAGVRDQGASYMEMLTPIVSRSVKKRRGWLYVVVFLAYDHDIARPYRGKVA